MNIGFTNDPIINFSEDEMDVAIKQLGNTQLHESDSSSAYSSSSAM